MIAKRTKWLSTALLYGLGALSVIFVVELSWLASDGRDLSFEGAGLEDIVKTEALTIRDIGAEPDFEEILDRPLFAWNRKPKVPDAITPEASSGDLDSRWELSGIIATGATHYAYFHPVSGGQPSRLEEGMYIEKWQVKSIEPEQVILIDSDAEQIVFPMKETMKPVAKKKLRSKLARRKKRPEPGRSEAAKAPAETTQKAMPDSKEK